MHVKTRIKGSVSACALLVICAPVSGPAATNIGVTAPSDGGFVVRLSLEASLNGLDAAIANGSWACSARVMTRSAIDAEIAKIMSLTGKAARDEFASALEHRAHYLSQQVVAEFPVSGGAYTGSQAIVLRISGYDLADQRTGRVIDNPAVMVGCWLHLSTGSGREGYAYQTTSAATGSQDTMLQVNAAPYVLLAAPIHDQS